jgi:site-specific DNA-cytosine methylase
MTGDLGLHPKPFTRPQSFGAACRDLDVDGPGDRPLHRFVAAYAPYHPGGYNTDEAVWRRVNPGRGSFMNLKWLSWDRVCGTLPAATSTVNGHVHPRRTRYLSLAELRRLATFPDDFVFPGTYKEIEWRVGNAVPPALARAVGTHLRSVLPLGDRPTVVSTFAGAGGSGLGYRQAGFVERLAVENQPHALACLAANFPEVPLWPGDIRRLSGADALARAGLLPGQLDLLDGSPPCQGFSSSGNRILDDPRNALFREFARLLAAFRPRCFVMENVSGMIKGKMKLLFAEILATLKAAGYVVQVKLLNAMYFGVPQDRERLIFVGVRADLAADLDRMAALRPS